MMHYTLHLTSDCNCRCDYCYVKNTKELMSKEVAFAVIDRAISDKQLVCGIAFFGGEPLLQKNLIKETVAYARRHSQSQPIKFYFKMTTNGLLLDEDFIKFCKQENVFVAVSLDGIQEAHNKHRFEANGQGTYERVVANAKTLLSYMPNSPVMMTVNPDTVANLAPSVQHLYDLGFVYLLCGFNYAADWNSGHLKELKKQYRLLADFYYKNTMAENKFYLSPFETKINSHINHQSYCQERCDLGKKQLSVAPNGDLFPCVEFISDSKYKIGDVFSGVNENLRQALYQENQQEKPGCDRCAIARRCNHYCGCQNLRATGSLNSVSPILCRQEQMVLAVADRLAERLYKKRSGLFIQKHYNEYYPIFSVIEERLKQRN